MLLKCKRAKTVSPGQNGRKKKIFASFLQKKKSKRCCKMPKQLFHSRLLDELRYSQLIPTRAYEIIVNDPLSRLNKCQSTININYVDCGGHSIDTSLIFLSRGIDDNAPVSFLSFSSLLYRRPLGSSHDLLSPQRDEPKLRLRVGVNNDFVTAKLRLAKRSLSN